MPISSIILWNGQAVGLSNSVPITVIHTVRYALCEVHTRIASVLCLESQVAKQACSACLKYPSHEKKYPEFTTYVDHKSKDTKHEVSKRLYGHCFGASQCFFFSRIIGQVTLKIIYFHYLKKNPDQSISDTQKICF